MYNHDEKYQTGLSRLRDANTNPDLLGLALQSFHGALEDYLRSNLSTAASVTADDRVQAADRQQGWKVLLPLAIKYGYLRPDAERFIGRMNSYRNGIAHGGRFTGTRAEVEEYERLVRSVLHPRARQTPPSSAVASPAERSAPQLRVITTASNEPAAAQPKGHGKTRGRSTGCMLLAITVTVGFLIVFGMQLPNLLSSGSSSAFSASSAGQETTQVQTTTLSGSLPGSAQNAPPDEPVSGTVTAVIGNLSSGRVNFREQPNTEAPVIASLDIGTQVTVLDETTEDGTRRWRKVEVDGRQGWVSEEFLVYQ
jgi:hypothetical protein